MNYSITNWLTIHNRILSSYQHCKMKIIRIFLAYSFGHIPLHCNVLLDVENDVLLIRNKNYLTKLQVNVGISILERFDILLWKIPFFSTC